MDHAVYTRAVAVEEGLVRMKHGGGFRVFITNIPNLFVGRRVFIDVHVEHAAAWYASEGGVPEILTGENDVARP